MEVEMLFDHTSSAKESSSVPSTPSPSMSRLLEPTPEEWAKVDFVQKFRGYKCASLTRRDTLWAWNYGYKLIDENAGKDKSPLRWLCRRCVEMGRQITKDMLFHASGTDSIKRHLQTLHNIQVCVPVPRVHHSTLICQGPQWKSEEQAYPTALRYLEDA